MVTNGFNPEPSFEILSSQSPVSSTCPSSKVEVDSPAASCTIENIQVLLSRERPTSSATSSAVSIFIPVNEGACVCVLVVRVQYLIPFYKYICMTKTLERNHFKHPKIMITILLHGRTTTRYYYGWWWDDHLFALLRLLATLFLLLFSCSSHRNGTNAFCFTRSSSSRRLRFVSSSSRTIVQRRGDDPDFFSSNGRQTQNYAAPALGSTKINAAAVVVDERWYYSNRMVTNEKVVHSPLEEEEIERKSVDLAADLIREQLKHTEGEGCDTQRTDHAPLVSFDRPHLLQDRFMDLATSSKGIERLERLFYHPIALSSCNDTVRGAVMCLQSLCILGSQVGLKGTPVQLARQLAHLNSTIAGTKQDRTNDSWSHENIRQLKLQQHRVPAIQLLAALGSKRTAQGAFDILKRLGVWEPHENVALIRSGFALGFSRREEQAALDAEKNLPEDVDELLHIRKDLRHLKTFTIDGADTAEVDDALSLEEYKDETGATKRRVWIHIADADHVAPRNSDLFEAARIRVTSLYLADRSISMFPEKAATELMSLRPNQDSRALSMGVEIHEDGSVDKSSIILTSSTIRVDYQLTYEEVDEMLEEGIGYLEEWELGSLLDIAAKRREYRISCGSSEGLVPNPIPQGSVKVSHDPSTGQPSISIQVEVSHNAGANHTAESNSLESDTAPVSSAFLLVTECMIMAGEAMGHFKSVAVDDEKSASGKVPRSLDIRLPFRTQLPPNFKSRARERKVLTELLEYKPGHGFCHAWFMRRFLEGVQVKEESSRHSGLGLTCYVQWTSPIRRFTDLQVHCLLKRFLRRKAVLDLVSQGKEIPPSILPSDLGISLPNSNAAEVDIARLMEEAEVFDDDINYFEGLGFMGAARTLQRLSQQYWVLEYVRRKFVEEPSYTYDAVVLGCTDPGRNQYAIYVLELGLEHRYSSPYRLDFGMKIRFCVGDVKPRNGILSFVRQI